MIEFYETYASGEFLFSVVTQLQNDENQKQDIFYPLYRSLFIARVKLLSMVIVKIYYPNLSIGHFGVIFE